MRTLLALILFSTMLPAQTVPHPYVLGTVDLMPSGYAPLAFSGGGGIMWDRPYLVFDSYAGYDNGRKANDNTVGNYKGHDRFVRGFVGLKVQKYYAGVGARWSQLSTTNYTKGGDIFSAGSWHPVIAGGRDWSTRTSPNFLRTQIGWMFSPSKETVHYPDGTNCDGCGNGTHGVPVTIWLPSPARPGHFFFKMEAVIFRFHDTITDPTNVPLTRIQSSNWHLADSTEISVGYRF